MTTPTRIGRFRIDGVLGEGAAGRVFRAYQDDPEREVALKVLRTASLDAESLARFRRESDLLAGLEHPHIARVYQAGADETDTGPVYWLAMEFVRGDDIVTHARALPLAGRLSLLAALARAVHFAHARGVVHRDLKPANILVDEHGAPRILDFGVAHDADATLTRTGAVIGTVPYMSPEQLAGDGRTGDPRHDVYALGVIGYELVTGTLPYPGLAQAGVLDALKLVRASGPVRPSQHAPEARGDLDTVLMKALAHDPDQRYGSAAEFAADIERVLGARPIEARPPTVRYVLSLFVRRHRAFTAAVTFAFAALVVATVVSLQAAGEERRARAAADARTAELESVNAFLVRMLTSADPENARGRAITVREVVDEARHTLAADAALPASVADTLRRTLGLTYASLGEHDIALELLRAARGAAVAGGDAALADHLLVEIAGVMQEKGLYAEAEAALAPLLAAPTPADDDALRVRFAGEQTRAQVVALAGRTEEALVALEGVYARAVAAFGADDPLTTSIGSDYATVLRDSNRLDEAERLADEVWRNRVARLGDDHPDALLTRNLIGAIQHARQDNDAALATLTEVAAARERVLGPDHIQTLTTLQNVAAVLVVLGRQEDALPILARVVDGTVAHFGDTHTRSLRVQNILAYALEDTGRLDEAESVFRRIIAARERSGVAPHIEDLAHYNNLAMLRLKRDDPAEAVAILDQLLIDTRAAVGDAHPYYLIFESNLGDALNQAREYARAVAALEHAHAGLTAIAGATHPRTATAATRLATAYRALGREADAAALVPAP